MTDAEILALKKKILEAETAYHDLMTAASLREFTDQNGEKTVYSQANRSALYAYILSLKAQLPDAPTGGYGSKPLGFVF